MDKIMLNGDIGSYEREVEEYVNGTLLASLTVEMNGDIAKQKRNLLIADKILSDPEFKEKLVNRITAHTMKYSMLSYKENLSSSDRRKVFMRQVYSFLSMNQMSLLAVAYTQQIEATKTQEHSR